MYLHVTQPNEFLALSAMHVYCAGGLQKNFEIFVESLGTFVPLLRPEDAINENEAGLSASSSSLPPTVQDTNARCVWLSLSQSLCTCCKWKVEYCACLR